MTTPVKHLRSATPDKRPTASGMADGRLAINTASGTPGLYFVNNASGIVKVGPAHVGPTAPNESPAGSTGNSLGELWVNNSSTIHGLNYYTGSAFINLTPSGTTTVAGLVELATDAETQTGTDTVRAVTPSGLQSKISDSTSTASSTTIASATAVKAAYDLADTALPKTGGRMTGNLEIGPTGSLSFEGSSDDSFETTIAVVNPTADRSITLPNESGTVITTGSSGQVTSTMIADGTIVNADINASAAIVDTKLATISTAGKVSDSALPDTISSNITGSSASCTGNAATATTLQTAQTINGISFNGSASINVPDLRASNGTTLIDGTGVTSAVNYISLTNAATGGIPTLSTAGSDTNINLNITTKGTGTLSIATTGGNISLRPTAGAILFYDASNTYYTNLENGSLTANRTLTMPNSDVTLVGGTMVPTTGTGATGTWGISISGNSLTATSSTNCSRSVIAGNGVTGGGVLNADRTITLGTPSTLTSSTTNSVTSSSHTHAVTFPVEIPAGTQMLFVQTAAPTGWTKVTTHNNKALRVVNGTASSGGSTAFTTVFTSRTPTGTNSGGSVGDRSLTTSQLPSHQHTISNTASDNLNTGTFVKTISYFNTTGTGTSTGNAGSGSAHNHPFTQPTWTGAAMDFAVQYVDVIIATKN